MQCRCDAAVRLSLVVASALRCDLGHGRTEEKSEERKASPMRTKVILFKDSDGLRMKAEDSNAMVSAIIAVKCVY